MVPSMFWSFATFPTHLLFHYPLPLKLGSKFGTMNKSTYFSQTYLPSNKTANNLPKIFVSIMKFSGLSPMFWKVLQIRIHTILGRWIRIRIRVKCRIRIRMKSITKTVPWSCSCWSASSWLENPFPHSLHGNTTWKMHNPLIIFYLRILRLFWWHLQMTPSWAEKSPTDDVIKSSSMSWLSFVQIRK